MSSTMESRTIESSLAEVRRWEDLNTDCLVKIFGRVGLESLIVDVSFVCKSWYKASLDPMLYKLLQFEFMPVEERSRWATITLPVSARNKYSKLPPSTAFIKIAVNRSCGMATELVFPSYCGADDYQIESLFTVSALEYALERCPSLKTLNLPYFNFYMVGKRTDECLLKMISKLKHLVSLATLTMNYFLSVGILNQIHIHCKNFQSLTIRGHISVDITSEIVTLFPNIKHLVLSNCVIYHSDLVRILSSCSKLELLDVTYCRGFDGNDAMILNLASHINIFKSEGSVLNYGDGDVSDDNDDDYNERCRWVDNDEDDSDEAYELCL